MDGKRVALGVLAVCGAVGWAGLPAAVQAKDNQQARRETPEVAATVDTGTSALTALSVTPSSMQCSRGRIAMAANGKLGLIVPVIGPTVLRGSAEPATEVRFAMVDLDKLGGDAGRALVDDFTVCVKAR
jgi:hypothetical protein